MTRPTLDALCRTSAPSRAIGTGPQEGLLHRLPPGLVVAVSVVLGALSGAAVMAGLLTAAGRW